MRVSAGTGWPSGDRVPLLWGDPHGLSERPGQGLGSGVWVPDSDGFVSPGRARGGGLAAMER